MKKNLLVLFLFFVTFVSAQWNSNTAVNLEIAGVQASDIQTVSTNDGKTWVAFYQSVGAAFQMRAQLLDVDGTKLLGANGVLVSSQPTGSATYVFNVCLADSNSLIIAHQYEVSGTLNAVLSKVSTAGNLSWGNGVVLGAGLAPYPTTLSGGDIAVAWSDGVTNTLTMTKVSATGAISLTPYISVKIGTSTTTRGQLIGNNNNYFTLIMQKKSFGISTTLYALRYSSEGIAQWATPLQLSNQTSSGARYYSLLAEADTTYLGYYVSVGSRFNSFIQRINPNGTLPYGINGAAFDDNQTTSSPYQLATSIATTPGSAYLWGTSNFCNTSQSQYGLFVQKILKSTGAKQLGTTAKTVYSISANLETQIGNLALYNDAPIFILTDKDYKIYATRLDSLGSFIWTPNRFVISSTNITSASNPKGRYAFNFFNDQGVGIWNEYRTTEYRGYAQNITATGLTGPILPITLTDFKAIKRNATIDLLWITATEINNKGFYVERSSNITQGFKAIGYIASKAVAGNSSNTLAYNLVDENPIQSINYYRLKQVDINGKFSYSNIVSVKNNNSNFNFKLLQTNIQSNCITVKTTAANAAKFNCSITTVNGQMLCNKLIEVLQGEYYSSLKLNNITAGIYVLTVKTNEGEIMHTEKFIKE